MTSGSGGLRGAAATFWWRAYEDNLTGMAGMVAYNLLLSLFPLALLGLFVAGRVLASPDFEARVLADLGQLFPLTARGTLEAALDRVRGSSASFGVIALVSSVWIGSSFWGALDTAFCQIYHVPCRGWVAQKRFALLMLVVVLLFMAATVAVPALQTALVAGSNSLPFGLDEVAEVVFAGSLVVGILLIFVILCAIYWTVPNRRVPWLAVWPGALGATAAIAVIDYAFPLYLSRISAIGEFGTTFVFVLIVLVWFFVLAIVILVGATVNALRFELHETGSVDRRA
ncbi:MAG TPA: YhjD/YihY/BrkB family envelope integrity protein [Thermoleophilaceae bacterium]|nr:YhjD/YihY/BrkB family envelope integrity protein [Thermoleophilaceae bacterium]